ncbi:hypothetical protein LEP1GSC173_4091 [Leptospira interrogans str. HAI1594]|uniref:Uncharacterized protein n=8 Tax=Leptospira interrogans TaxID=173 RepID=A0A0E2D141_LEPIR|nr:hypothetical protein G436_0323 [Leptospira interrogans serovar Hardjo str. Norma]EJP02191.1 hypothetical protein LEP1GSC007_4204 [Leptospira interrogans serovar Bulgarica str. Mallika]EJP15707.1 hypothetical protein LEP1GSC080_3914 [Leptospira interrogans str. FPW2026]EKO06096.1 hypothetical protein LEP1GSC077_2512 [Leptospira interrogans str. C10069]EKO23106.1 hypothetical protein LEP1GSC104_4233 [Leptospira interrogans str. UI 12621]EKO87827.1 hypothetical protein LEP1GSC009_3164 [Leptosp
MLETVISGFCELCSDSSSVIFKFWDDVYFIRIPIERKLLKILLALFT